MHIYHAIKVLTFHPTTERHYSKKYWKRHVGTKCTEHACAQIHIVKRWGSCISRLLHAFCVFTPVTSLMATMHVASIGADRSLEKQGWKSPRLPEIVHPMQRAGDRSTLAVRGLSSRQSASRDAHGELNLDASSRPATCPENNFGRGTSRAHNSRPATSLGPSTSAVHLGVDEVLDTAT